MKNLVKGFVYFVLIIIVSGCITKEYHPKIEVLPDSWDFGNVAVGSYSDKEFTIRNNGTGSLAISEIKFTSGNAIDFEVLNGDTSFTLKRNDEHKITVRFTPSTSGPRTTTMHFEHNVDNVQVDIQLQGIGTQPQFDITPTTWNFNLVNLGTSDSKDFEIKNTGNGDLSVSAIVFVGGDTGDFTISAGGTSFMVAPGNSHKISVDFTPGALGNRSTTMEITHNAPGSTVNVTLDGVGTLPSFNITPDKWDYGVVFLGDYRDKEFDIENTGTGVLSVTKIDFSGAADKDFTIFAGGTSFQVNPGNTHKITVRFSPTSLGSRTASMKLLHDGASSPTYVRLEGMGAIFLNGPSNSTITVGSASDITGIAVDKTGGYIWASCDATDTIYCLNYNSPYAEISKFSTPARDSVGLTFYDGYLYSADAVTKKVYKITSTSGSASVLFDVSSRVNKPSGIAYDGNYFYVADSAGKIFTFTSTGNLYNTISSPISEIGGIIINGGNLYVTDVLNDKILIIDSKTGAVVKSVSSPVSKPFALGWDGTDFYVASANTNVIKKFVP